MEGKQGRTNTERTKPRNERTGKAMNIKDREGRNETRHKKQVKERKGTERAGKTRKEKGSITKDRNENR